MKAKSLLLALCGAFVSLTASAQFGNGGSSISTSTANHEDSWGKFYVNYNPTSIEDFDFNGISAGFSKATSISSSMPLYLEWGLGLNYMWTDDQLGGGGYDDDWYDDDWYDYSKTRGGYSDEYDDGMEYKTYMFSAFAPINLTYKFDANEKISIAPYAGLRLRYNILGESKVESEYGEHESNLFDEDDMGKDGTFNRFQIGYQIGVNAMFDRFSVGLEYEGYFTEIGEKADLSGWSIGVGILF